MGQPYVQRPKIQTILTGIPLPVIQCVYIYVYTYVWKKQLSDSCRWTTVESQDSTFWLVFWFDSEEPKTPMHMNNLWLISPRFPNLERPFEYRSGTKSFPGWSTITRNGQIMNNHLSAKPFRWSLERLCLDFFMVWAKSKPILSLRLDIPIHQRLIVWSLLFPPPLP